MKLYAMQKPLRTIIFISASLFFNNACSVVNPSSQSTANSTQTLSSEGIVVQSDLFPQTAVAAWTGVESRVMIAVTGDPLLPNIRLWSGNHQPIQLPLGITPRDLTGYALPSARSALLWLDQGLDQQQIGRYTLFAATLDALDDVERGPTPVSTAPVSHYAAVVLPDGGLLIVWSAAADPGETSAVYVQKLDVSGRAQPPVQIARDGTLPRLTLDFEGSAHIGWLQTTDSALWSLQYLRLSKEQALAGEPDTTMRALPLGITRLAMGEAPTGLIMAADRGSIYGLWTVEGFTNGVLSHRVTGLNFPIGQPERALSFGLEQTSDPTIQGLAVVETPADALQLIGVGSEGRVGLYSRGKVTNTFTGGVVDTGLMVRSIVPLRMQDGQGLILVVLAEVDGQFALHRVAFTSADLNLS